MGNCCGKKKKPPPPQPPQSGPVSMSGFSERGVSSKQNSGASASEPRPLHKGVITVGSKTNASSGYSTASGQQNSQQKPTATKPKVDLESKSVARSASSAAPEPKKAAPAVQQKPATAATAATATVTNLERIKSDVSLARSTASSVSPRSADGPPSTPPPTEKMLAKVRDRLPAEREDLRLVMSPRFQTMHKIIEEVYLTGYFGLTQENLARNKITTVINATQDQPNMQGYDCLRISVDDDPKEDIFPFLDTAADKIYKTHKAGGRSVVHCMAGVSRSTALVLAYLLKYKKWTLRKAYKHIVSIREVARPNSAFIRALVRYEREMVGTCSTRVIRERRGDVVIEMPDFLKSDLPTKYEAEFEENRAMNRVNADEPEEQVKPLLQHFVTRATSNLSISPYVPPAIKSNITSSGPASSLQPRTSPKPSSKVSWNVQSITEDKPSGLKSPNKSQSGASDASAWSNNSLVSRQLEPSGPSGMASESSSRSTAKEQSGKSSVQSSMDDDDDSLNLSPSLLGYKSTTHDKPAERPNK